jgi:hypothetical protein
MSEQQTAVPAVWPPEVIEKCMLSDAKAVEDIVRLSGDRLRPLSFDNTAVNLSRHVRGLLSRVRELERQAVSHAEAVVIMRCRCAKTAREIALGYAQVADEVNRAILALDAGEDQR